MADLFDQSSLNTPHPEAKRPLADRCRPTKLSEVIGQQKLVGPDGSLSAMLAAGNLGSIIFWGPPGPYERDGHFVVRGRNSPFQQITTGWLLTLHGRWDNRAGWRDHGKPVV